MSVVGEERGRRNERDSLFFFFSGEKFLFEHPKPSLTW